MERSLILLVSCVGLSLACFRPVPPPPPPATTTTTTQSPPVGNVQCGGVNRISKIVGGVATTKNEYPWQIGLTTRTGSVPYCGGSIISKKEILTAAHCTQGTSAGNIYVLVGEHDITRPDGEQKIRVCSKAEHPSYNSRTTNYDFAVLTLCEEINFRQDAMPVCLPTSNGQGTNYENKAAVVSGWGTLSSQGARPSVLMETTVNTMSNSACCNSNTAYSCNEITSQMICASASGKDSCQGDSGGPLSVQDNGKYVLVGVVSWGYGCAQANAPGVYARVTNQLDWIKSKTTTPTYS